MRQDTGLSTTDSAQLFALPQKHITRLENTVRWTWAPGDIAIWDNRTTQHYAVPAGTTATAPAPDAVAAVPEVPS